MRVIFFHRKPRPNQNYSVESLFAFVRANLPSDIDWEVKELKYISEGFFKRLYIGIEAAINQKGINHITGDINFIALFLKKRYTILTILDIGFLNTKSQIKFWLLKLFWVALPVRRSELITTISNSVKSELLKRVKVDPNKVHVIYVPISEKFVISPKAFDHNKPTILQIGTKPNKNVIRLAKALHGIPCRLDIIGELDASTKQELIDNKIEYYSYINLSTAEVISRYVSADIVAFVSTYEGFGMPIVEANAVGRVVVTSNLSSMPEVAGKAAHLVDPFQVISIRNGFLKVINDDHYRNELIEEGKKNVTRFKASEIAKQYAELYRLLKN